MLWFSTLVANIITHSLMISALTNIHALHCTYIFIAEYKIVWTIDHNHTG